MSNKTNLSVINIPNVTKNSYREAVIQGGDFVTYGGNNKFPEEMWQLYTECPTHQSIIDGTVDYIVGNGVVGIGDEIVNENGDTLNTLIKKAALDLKIYGGFAFQVVYNKAGAIYGVYWVDFAKLRISKNAKEIGYNESWVGQKGTIIKYNAFNMEDADKTSQILYVKSGTSRSIYPIPSYFAAIPSILTEVEIQDYHLNNITNGFAASTLINMNNGIPEEEERKEMERSIENKFSGSKGAGKILINWNENVEAASTVSRIDTDNLDTKFEQLAKSTQRNIFIAHRVTSPILFGIVPENTGFSKAEYQESFDVYNATVIKPLQKEIVRALTAIYKQPIEIEPFKI